MFTVIILAVLNEWLIQMVSMNVVSVDYYKRGSGCMFMGLFYFLFLLIIGVFILTFIKGIGEWSKNNNSPRLTVEASVVAKRKNVTHHQHANAGDATGAHGYTNTMDTTYYVTFQVESGDRLELRVSGSEYGMLVEGDCGKLSFQGTRYHGFERR